MHTTAARGRCPVGAAVRGWRAVAARFGATCLAVAVTACVAGCAGSSAGQPPRYELQARVIPGLGKIVTDGQGFTLYLYELDHQGVSQCTGACAKAWPPLVLPRGVPRARAGRGISGALLGTTRRAGGILQVTYNKWPLYLWQGDGAPGMATGQRVGMGWFVISVTGAVDPGTPVQDR
jgi:predicted lipoprotein with Yx(FWY)xxD motif